MEKSRAKIIDALKDYPNKQRQIAQLKIELEHPAKIGDKELIESLSLGSSIHNESAGHSGRISNKTMMIALQYQDVAQRMNNDAVFQITQQLHSLKAEIAKLERYVSLLKKRQEEVVRLYYFEGHSWSDIEEMLHLSKRALLKHRDEAIDELTIMFFFIEQVKNNPIENV